MENNGASLLGKRRRDTMDDESTDETLSVASGSGFSKRIAPRIQPSSTGYSNGSVRMDTNDEGDDSLDESPEVFVLHFHSLLIALP
jgi:hypothetical protein